MTKKIVLLGDSSVGKTSLVRRYVIDLFDDKYVVTIGTKVMKKDIEYKLPARTIHLTMMIWDVLGQREFGSVRSVGLRGSNGAIFVADITRPETVSAIVDFWAPQVRNTVGDVPTMVLGNKSDLLKNQEDAKGILSSIASEVSGPYLICSAKTGENVERAFLSMGELLIGDVMAEDREISIPQESSIQRAVDFIIADFCEQYGDIAKGMEMTERLFHRAGLDINVPNKERILETLEYMSEIEKDRLGRDIAEINKLRRWRTLEESEGDIDDSS